MEIKERKCICHQLVKKKPVYGNINNPNVPTISNRNHEFIVVFSYFNLLSSSMYALFTRQIFEGIYIKQWKGRRVITIVGYPMPIVCKPPERRQSLRERRGLA